MNRVLPIVLLLGACEAPGYERDVAPIVDANCVACHQGTEAASALDMTEGAAVLVDQPSGQSDLLIVEPGNALYSYLFHKVNGTQGIGGGAGTTMPVGTLLTDEEVDVIVGWIDEGAMP